LWKKRNRVATAAQIAVHDAVEAVVYKNEKIAEH